MLHRVIHRVCCLASERPHKIVACNAGCTLSPSEFGEGCLRRDWVSTTLHTPAESSILARDTRRQLGKTQDL